MRFLTSLAAIAALSVSGVSAIQCVVKSTSAGATACTTVDSVSTEIIGGAAVSIDIPKFDTVANGGAILDAVWINWIDADYNPTVTYRSTIADTNSFTVSVSVADTWTLFSAVDNKPFSRPVLDAAANQGGMSVDPTQAGFTDGVNPCIKETDSFTHTTNCLDGGILSTDFKMTDTTFASQTLTVASGVHSFNPDFTAGQTYVNFEGPSVNTATSGVRVTTTTPNAGYSTAGAGGNWQITTSTGAALTTPTNVAGSFTVNGGSGGTVTVQVTHSLKLQFEIQYDYHLPSVGGDPQFAGFQGQNFQVHGAPDSYFALISAPNYYVNARFDYLSTGSCTYNETQCFTHPGTYMGLVYVGMKDANVLIQAGAHATGFAGVLVNDKQLSIGDRVNLPASPNSYIQMLSKSKLVLALDNVVVNVVNSDHFVNFDLSLTDKQLLTTGSAYHVMPNGATPSQIAHKLNKWYGSFNPLHGLIGQTWRNVKYADNKLYQGDITEYQLDKIVDHTFLYCVYEP